MIWHDVKPLSQEWRTLRLGIPTASQFSRILTPKKMQISSQAPKYMAELLAEWITGAEIDGRQGEATGGYSDAWMQRGQEVEDQIWMAYENYAEVETSRGGFFTTDDSMMGCSPDRLIGTEGDLEAKAPMIQTQVAYALNGGVDDDYLCQLQGRMMIHERAWVDIFSWHPKLFIPPIRVYRDDDFINRLRPVLAAFVETLLEARVKLEQRYGPFTRPEPPDAQTADGLNVSEEDLNAILAAQQTVAGHPGKEK